MAPTDIEEVHRLFPPEQRAILQKAFHRDDSFIPFDMDEIEQSMASRFEKQVTLYPNALSVKDGEEAWTYGMLNQAANRLAHALLAVPTTSGHVGLLLDNGIPVITAIWAVLKAGHAFITLDPQFPHDRLSYMAEDACADVIITSPHHLDLAETMKPAGSTIVNIDTLPAGLPTENPRVEVSPTDLAFIMYTSGSTGRPKGIMYNHRIYLHGIMQYTNTFHVTPKDRKTLLHSCSFSSGITDIFRPLLNGAALYVWDFKAKGFVGLADWLTTEEITYFHWVPTPFRYFVETLTPEQRFPHLRLLLLGSEQTTLRDVAAYKQITEPTCVMVNRLGASETFNFRLFLMDHDTELTGSTVPVGYAVPVQEVILYGENGDVITWPNQVGEIGVRSSYLALGYWQQPTLTEQAFRPDPDGSDKRIYMTGDLGRIDEDGCMKYFGRKDFQVKIHGHRIEVSEIELCLLKNDWLKDVLVMAREYRPGDQQLVAYVVPAQLPASFSAADLRTFIAGQLPAYMIPSSFVILDALPVTPSGKIDRNALPHPAEITAPKAEANGTSNHISEYEQNLLSHPANAFIKFEKEEIEQSIPHRFEEQVIKYPQRLAVKSRDHEYTYEALNQQANRIAQALLAKLGEREAPVVLIMGQGTLVVAAILGVLKAGKYYVPIDTQDPLSRISKVLEDLNAALILTDNDNFALSSEFVHSECSVLNIEAMDTSLSVENPGLSLTPDHLAYIFYTSGSTGRPKGVVDNHRNVLHNIMRYTNTLHICKDDRLSLVQSPNFSGTVSSLFGALLNGATICPINLRAEGMDRLAAWINEMGVTIYHSVPTIFRSFLSGDVQFPLVRLIRLEGDRSSRLDLELHQKYFHSTCLLVNGLGTTETGLCRQYFIHKESRVTDHILPIGYPVMDMDILLLDEAGQEVDVNQTGQIAVKSRYLSLGYWQQPELTQASFFPDPQGEETRIYHTGDVGRLRPDGCMEYLGRKNFQLKVRGQKVEPAEVEQTLLGLNFFREAAVMTHEDQQGEAQLVAYLVCHPGVAPSTIEMRRLLRQQLPDALIPTRYVFLNDLPVTTTGKIDRNALPHPSEVALSEPSLQSYTPPLTATEKELALIWENLLTVERVGQNDHFYDLGGHSLLAAQMFTRIEKHFGRRLSLSALFQAPTLGALAALIDQNDTRMHWSSLVPIQPDGSKPPLFFVHAHDGNVIGYYELAKHLGPDQPFYGIQARGLDGQTAPIDCFAEMAAAYIKEIKSVQRHGPYYLGGYCFGAYLAQEMAQQLKAQGEEVGLLVMVPLTPYHDRRFNPETPLLRRIMSKIVRRLDIEWQQWSRLRELPAHLKTGHVFDRVRRLKDAVADKLEKTSATGILSNSRTTPQSNDDHQALLEAAHVKAYRSHHIRPYTGASLLMRSRRQSFHLFLDEALGWKDIIEGDLAVYEFPGPSIGLLSKPRVQLAAKQLAYHLEKAQDATRHTPYEL